MENPQAVCLLNDSFPPLIDGVANAVINYAKELPKAGFMPVVVTPAHPDADDSGFRYPVARYPSICSRKFEGYPAGLPFSPAVAGKLRDQNIALLHSHCPVMSTYLARQLRQKRNVPIVFTYHTRFDVDIQRIFKSKPLQLAGKKALAANIAACNEVWTVSRGAGENLRSLGYEGDYTVMPNGVDLPCCRPDALQIAAAVNGFDLPDGVPVYLFVGRMLWHKGLRIIIDALAHMQAQGRCFRMVFIGDGEDRIEIEKYASAKGILPRCIFTGTVRDRERLRGWYGRADLFLFPSSYDTNGLVVREAAACSLASVLIKGSCAAEGVTDGRNGFLISENADSLAACLCALTKENMQSAGRAASRELYLSWEAAVRAAADRYEIILEKYKSGL